MHTNNAIIIVAGGKGLRMGTDIPKQFLPIGGKPVLMHTIERFHSFDPQMQIILVLPESQQSYWRTLCEEHRFTISHDIINGGETRFHSVKNGLSIVAEECELIGVHDGVRPFVSEEVIGNCYAEARNTGAAIPVIDVFETVRHITPQGSETVPRSDYKLVQTPQVFSADLLRKAYAQPFREFFTDDASVVESFGRNVSLVCGNRENIKITTPYDITIAKAIIAS